MDNGGIRRDVLRGMELLAWETFPVTWQHHLWNEEHPDQTPPGKIVAIAATWLVWGASILVSFRLVSAMPILAFAILGLAFLVWRSVSPARQPPSTPPRVLFTSTGVLFGEDAWLWKGDGHRLDERSPPLVKRGYDDSTPHVLELTFLRPWRRRTRVRIPVPDHLLRDVRQLEQHLRARLAGATGDNATRCPRPAATPCR